MGQAQVSSWTPPELALRAADSGVREYSAEDLKEAREDLAEKLREGKTVARCTFRDLIDCEFNCRPNELLGELDTLLRLSGGSDTAEGYASTLRDQIIARHLDANEEAVRERAVEIAAGRLEIEA